MTPETTIQNLEKRLKKGELSKKFAHVAAIVFGAVMFAGIPTGIHTDNPVLAGGVMLLGFAGAVTFSSIGDKVDKKIGEAQAALEGARHEEQERQEEEKKKHVAHLDAGCPVTEKREAPPLPKIKKTPFTPPAAGRTS